MRLSILTACVALALGQAGCGGDSSGTDADTSGRASEEAEETASLVELDLEALTAPVAPELPGAFADCGEPLSSSLGPEADTSNTVAYGDGSISRISVSCVGTPTVAEIVQYETASQAPAYATDFLATANPNIFSEVAPDGEVPDGTTCLRLDNGSSVTYQCHTTAENFFVSVGGLSSVADASEGIAAARSWLEALAAQAAGEA